MAIDISSTTRRIVYTGSAGVGPYAFNFEVLAETDIAVYFNYTELTLTTDYTVTVDANGTGEISIVTGTNVPTTPDADDRITIVGDRTIERSTDFTTGGPLFATSLNDEFDSQTIFVQQVQEQADRALRAPNTDPTNIDMTLPNNVDRANKTLAFDSDGNPIIGEQIGDWKGDWAASTSYNKRDLVKDTTTDNVYICIVAHTSSGALPITTNTDSAKWDLVVDAAAAATAQAAAEAAQAAAETAETNAETAQAAAELAETNAETAQTAAEAAQSAAETAQTGAETAETNAETAQTAAEAAQAAAEAVFDNFDDSYLGAKASDPTLDNDGDALADGALYFDTTNNVMKVYDLGTTTWYQLTPTVSNQTNINTVAGIASDVSAVAAIDSDVTTVAGIDTDVTAVAADATDIGIVATNIANVNTTAGSITNVNTTATNISNVNTVAGISANVTTVAGDTAEIATVAGNTTNINTVAGVSADVTTVAGISSDVTTVATNVTDVVTFATTYLGAASSAPTTSTTGALYYNTVDEQLYVWDGSVWQAAAFSTEGAVTSFNTRTGAITLSASDVNTALGSDAVLDSDIGSTVQAYDATILKSADIGTSVQGYDADTAKLDVAQTFTADQTFSNDIAVNGLTVGKGANALVTNTVLGRNALDDPSLSGTSNTAVGNSTLSANTTGGGNAAIGAQALQANTTGSSNISIGYLSLLNNTTGGNNTAIGQQALASNVSGGSNTAVGNIALANNTAGNNTAIGQGSMYLNTTGGSNSALGWQSLYNNTTGSGNTAIARQTLFSNTTGANNVAFGTQSLYFNTTASNNTAVGRNALYNNTGADNVALGYSTGSTLTTGSNNTILGYDAEPSSPTVSNEITLGNASVNKVRMGNGDVLYGNGVLRAWVNFNGTGTVAIRESGNVSSITDNGTGKYIVNFTTAMPDANYSCIGICGTAGITQGLLVNQTSTTTTAPVFTVNTGGTLTDYQQVLISIHR